jgi:hypothetical protein
VINRPHKTNDLKKWIFIFRSRHLGLSPFDNLSIGCKANRQ